MSLPRTFPSWVTMLTGRHPHHHGIWTAWTVTEFEGRHLSFWGPEPGKSKNDLVSVGEPFSGPRVVGFVLIWTALALYAGDGLWRARKMPA